MTGRLRPVPRCSALTVLAARLVLLACVCAPAPLLSQTALLRQDAGSYSASGSYGIALTRGWADLSFGIFAPGRASRSGARFTELQLAFAGSRTDHTARLTFGRVGRMALDESRVLGLNAYLDLGQRSGVDALLAQASLGLEYEHAITGAFRDWRLRFGSNLYLPFADYTAPRYDSGAEVPRAGIDTYLSWSRAVGTGLDLSGRFSLFHYPASATRAARGLGTLTLTGRMTRNLPEGSALEAHIGTRFEPGSPPAPALSLTYSRLLPRPGAAASAPIGSLRPARDCRVVPEARGTDRIFCGADDYSPQSRPPHAQPPAAPDTFGLAVPPPRRHLGFGTFFTP